MTVTIHKLSVKHRNLLVALLGALLAFLCSSLALQAAEIKVFCLPGMISIFKELGPKFESASGDKLEIAFEVNGPLMRRIDAGDKFDVAIITPAEIENLTKRDKIAADSRVDLARVGVAVWIRSGAPKRDISTVDAFKRLLLDAKSISYTKESSTGMYIAGLIERLGIADVMRPKTKLLGGGGQNVRAVAAGEVEYGISILSDGIGQPGVEPLGLLPDEIQNWAVFVGAVAVDANQPAPARSLIKFLMSPEAAPVFKAKGFEPVKR